MRKMFAETPNEWSEGRQIDLVEVATGGVELIEQPKKMIRGATDGNGRKTFRLGNRSLVELFFRGVREEQAEMLALRQRRFRICPQERAQIRRRHELQTERGLFRSQRVAPSSAWA